MNKTVVINVVGLTRRLIGEFTPNIAAFLAEGQLKVIDPVMPAVTCTAQATYLTGKLPEDHGIVGNGWFFKEEQEVKFWRQSNHLVRAPKIWETLKDQDADFTCAKMFWWYNMYSTADFSVTPRPNYLADGRKIPDIYSHPAGLRDYLQNELGTFPLFDFWGPRTSIKSSKWIADATVLTDTRYDPTLSLVYLPHLDYNMQRFGYDLEIIRKDLMEIDTVVGELIDYFRSKNARIILLSEYGITNVNRPVHINRFLRDRGYISIRDERGLELLDAGASQAFAVADHQIAHIYTKNDSVTEELIPLLSQLPGVRQVWGHAEKKAAGLSHERAGDLVLVADSNSWFTYYYWQDDAKAPDFARSVDIHKKPGYDPVEMFTDPDDPWVMAKVGLKLLKKKMGFRTVMDIIPLKAELVKGSHGNKPDDTDDFPVIIGKGPGFGPGQVIKATDVYTILEEQITS